jgi:ribonuclease P protein component
MTGFLFSKSLRILTSAEFARTLDHRCSQSDSILVLYGRPNGLTHSRLGLVVSRKCGNSVLRSRWKRCLREAFRLSQHILPTGIDFVAIPRPAATPDTQRLQQSLARLAQRLARTLNSQSNPHEK